MHIQSGDVPTWLAVIVATFGGYVACAQLRQQGNVIKGEIERNKARRTDTGSPQSTHVRTARTRPGDRYQLLS